MVGGHGSKASPHFRARWSRPGLHPHSGGSAAAATLTRTPPRLRETVRATLHSPSTVRGAPKTLASVPHFLPIATFASSHMRCPATAPQTCCWSSWTSGLQHTGSGRPHHVWPPHLELHEGLAHHQRVGERPAFHVPVVRLAGHHCRTAHLLEWALHNAEIAVAEVSWEVTEVAWGGEGTLWSAGQSFVRRMNVTWTFHTCMDTAGITQRIRAGF